MGPDSTDTSFIHLTSLFPGIISGDCSMRPLAAIAVHCRWCDAGPISTPSSVTIVCISADTPASPGREQGSTFCLSGRDWQNDPPEGDTPTPRAPPGRTARVNLTINLARGGGGCCLLSGGVSYSVSQLACPQIDTMVCDTAGANRVPREGDAFSLTFSELKQR